MIIDWVGCSNNIWYEWDLYKRMIYTKEKIRENKIWRERERRRGKRDMKMNVYDVRNGMKVSI